MVINIRVFSLEISNENTRILITNILYWKFPSYWKFTRDLEIYNTLGNLQATWKFTSKLEISKRLGNLQVSWKFTSDLVIYKQLGNLRRVFHQRGSNLITDYFPSLEGNVMHKNSSENLITDQIEDLISDYIFPTLIS